VTSTTTAVVTPYTADEVVSIGSGVTLSPRLAASSLSSNPAGSESATFRFVLSEVVDPMTAATGWTPPFAPAVGNHWVLLKFSVTNVATSPGVNFGTRNGLFIDFEVEPELTNGSGRMLYSSWTEDLHGWSACSGGSVPSPGASSTVCQPFQVPASLHVKHVAVGFGFMTGSGAAPGQWLTGEWLLP